MYPGRELFTQCIQVVDDGAAKFDSIEQGRGEGRNQWFNVTLSEGRNREVRRLWESQGFTVSRLIRTGYGPLELPRRLRIGRFANLTNSEVKLLYKAGGLQSESSASGHKKKYKVNKKKGLRRKRKV